MLKTKVKKINFRKYYSYNILIKLKPMILVFLLLFSIFPILLNESSGVVIPSPNDSTFRVGIHAVIDTIAGYGSRNGYDIGLSYTGGQNFEQ